MPSVVPMIQPVARHSRLLLGANIVLAVLLLVGVLTQMLLGRWQSRSSGDPVSALIAPQAQFAAGLLMSELERVLQETRAAADLATHIFSNPESYRLAAQPGEYDYDRATGLYGSARNDGTSVVFLSAASILNPEILREIRLSEYLNPVFKTSATLNPLGRSIVLYTTDGLIRGYPWFDFKSRIASGALKSSFSVTELPFFARAMPSRNPLKEGVWQVFRSGSRSGEIQLVCAAPFFADQTFRGVIAVEVDAARLAAQLFTNLEPRDAVGLLMAVDGWVLGVRPTAGAKVELSGSLPDVLKNLKIPGVAGLEPTLRRLANTERFVGYEAGFHLAVAGSTDLPVRPALIVPASLTWQLGAARGSRGFPGWLLIGAGLACGLFLVDAWWIVQTRRNLEEKERKLSESFTALSDLNLQSALTVNPQSMLSELYPRLNEGLISIQKSVEAGPIEAVSEEGTALTDKMGRDLKLIQYQASVLRAFDAADSAQQNLNRLGAVLSGALGARLVSFFSYIESALRIMPRGVTGTTEEPTIEWKEGSLFNALNGSRRVVSSNTLALSTEEQQLSSVIQGNYLAVPLLDSQRLLGAVVVSGKTSPISVEEEELLGALQAVLSRAVQNIYQCDGLSKLNQLRREYCFELAKAVEAPLDRIRTEVQSIYSRLGKLTPYYKQHCETILFEVGKLYEMLREARETETVVESKSAEQELSSVIALATAEKKEGG